MNESKARVAVVHDWLTGMRGGEKVLEAILELYPSADIYTLFHFKGSVSPAIERHRIVVSPLQRFAKRVGDYRRLLPFYPGAIRHWNFDDYDLVISSSHAVAKGVAATPPHVSYCHTPMRYVWDRFDDYFPASRPVMRLVGSVVARRIRDWDLRTASEVDQFVANSEFVRRRIRNFYNRDAEVVYPFVDDAFFEPSLARDREPYHVVVSALVPYKKVELAVEAAKLGGKKLVVIGSGPMLESFRKSGGDGITFTGWADQKTLIETLGRARSLLFPGVEDFGITALEAMACGTPVVAFGEGGVLESVVDGTTGLFFHEQTPAALLAKMEEAERTRWDSEAIRSQARRFSKERFQLSFRAVVDRVAA